MTYSGNLSPDFSHASVSANLEIIRWDRKFSLWKISETRA